MRRRDWIVGVLLVAIVAEVAVAWGRNDAYSGVNLAYRDGQVVVASVDYGSPAYAQAVPPDWVVETVGDGNNLTDVLGETDAQKQLHSQALDLSRDIQEGRWLLIEKTQNSLPPIFLFVLILWLTLIFWPF